MMMSNLLGGDQIGDDRGPSAPLFGLICRCVFMRSYVLAMPALVLLFIVLLSILLPFNPVLAVVDGHEYPFEREVDAIRFKSLSQELRCPTCQNQNIADSNSPIAKSLKDQLYQLIKDGESDQAIRIFMTDRYGDFILYSPPFKPVTYLLWFGPLMILVLMAIIWKKVVYGFAKTDKAALDSRESD